VGLIKGYLWQNENGKIICNSNEDKDVSGMIKLCTKQGNINVIPEIQGILVFMDGHVGIYIGNGEVIEARGHSYGVVKTKLKDRSWTKWGMLNLISYVEEKAMTKEEKINFIKEKVGYDDNTMQYFQFYRYADDLIDKLVIALNK